MSGAQKYIQGFPGYAGLILRRRHQPVGYLSWSASVRVITHFAITYVILWVLPRDYTRFIKVNGKARSNDLSQQFLVCRGDVARGGENAPASHYPGAGCCRLSKVWRRGGSDRG